MFFAQGLFVAGIVLSIRASSVESVKHHGAEACGAGAVMKVTTKPQLLSGVSYSAVSQDRLWFKCFASCVFFKVCVVSDLVHQDLIEG